MLRQTRSVRMAEMKEVNFFEFAVKTASEGQEKNADDYVKNEIGRAHV